ncbi:hypothetical protein BKI52_16370 [marine bacterium AO1-C]|nr:hypothetical protein BKI52_16370 [marine bacterium AO1-C]
MNRFFVLCGLFLLISLSLCAQTPFQRIKFSSITSDRGLSQNKVNCVIQDRRGRLWFGTANGLDWYDGYQFKTYRNELGNQNSLGNNYIIALYEDRKGYIWIGTFGGGVNRFNPDTEEFVRYRSDKNDPHSLGGNEVGAFYEDKEGKIWMSCHTGHFSFLDPKSGKFKRYDRTKTAFVAPEVTPYKKHLRHVYSFINDGERGFWLGTANGLGYFDRQQKKYTKFFPLGKEQKGHYFRNAIYSIFRDRVNPFILWLGTYHQGLIKFDTQTNTIVKQWKANPNDSTALKTNSVWSFYQDRNNIYWVGTYNGFYKFNPDTNQFSLFAPGNSSISCNNIQRIFEDQSGNIWLCSYDRGISSFNPYISNFVSYSLPDKNIQQVSSFCEDKQGNIWFGALGGTTGLGKLDRTTGQIVTLATKANSLQNIGSFDVNTLLTDVDGSIWLGTFGKGLYHYDPTTEHFTNYDSQNRPNSRFNSSKIGVIYKDPDTPDVLWVGSRGDGLWKFDKKQKLYTEKYRFKQSTIIVVVKDYKGYLWVATRKGLNRFDPQSGSFVTYEHSDQNINSISDDYITALHIDPSNILWVGTRNGLNRLDLTQVYKDRVSFQHFTTNEGLPDNIIHKIIEDSQGFLWLSTSKGLSRFDKKDFFKNYDQQDGLQSNQFATNSGLLTTDGAIIMGGESGFNLFYPTKFKTKSYDSPVLFTDFQIANVSIKATKNKELTKAIWATDTIRLSHNDKIISFAFASLNYVSPNKNTYAIFMEGFDADWRYIGNKHTETYTNMPAGNYTFRVKSANKDGIWGYAEAKIVIVITPAWWETWWFKSGVVFIILTLLTVVALYIKKSKKPFKQQVVEISKQAPVKQQINEAASSDQQSEPTNLRILRNQAEIDELKQKLHQVVVKQKLYKEEDISLASVAQKMGTTERKLSELFSKELATNFYEYINTCKIDAFKQSVERGDAEHLTLLAIAYESGFHSKATFNRIFKKHTGLTPSEFKKQIENKN